MIQKQYHRKVKSENLLLEYIETLKDAYLEGTGSKKGSKSKKKKKRDAAEIEA